MRGEIITIGDELITGRVPDQNAHYLSSRLSSLGLVVTSISTVGDVPGDILEVLGRAVGRSDFILICGGLGPTEDDITTEVAAKFLKCPLVLNTWLLEYIKQSLTRRGLPWVDAYEKLALMPEGARLIDPQGTACGFYCRHQEVPLFFLPGVPEEVRYLAESKVLPLLLSYDREPAVVRQRLYKIFGLAEARIGELLEGLAGREEGVLLGYYPNFPENHVSVTIRGRTVGQTEEALERLGREVEAVLAPYVVARDGASLEEAVGRVLTERGLTLAVAESCTGGLIGHRLTSVSGSSAYFERGVVAYSNRSKIALLGVRPEVLERYGAVSAETARAMAEGARTSSGASLGLATTGIAGPTGGTPDKPVGTVYIALDSGKGAEAEHFLFPGDRAQVKMLTAETALARLLRFLKP